VPKLPRPPAAAAAAVVVVALRCGGNAVELAGLAPNAALLEAARLAMHTIRSAFNRPNDPKDVALLHVASMHVPLPYRSGRGG